MATRKAKAPYRLKFGGTQKTIPAASLKQALLDAGHWVRVGQLRVCVEKRLPSGRYEQVKCLRRQ